MSCGFKNNGNGPIYGHYNQFGLQKNHAHKQHFPLIYYIKNSKITYGYISSLFYVFKHIYKKYREYNEKQTIQALNTISYQYRKIYFFYIIISYV